MSDDRPAEPRQWLRQELEWVIAETEGVDQTPYSVGTTPAWRVAFENDRRKGHVAFRAAREVALRGLACLDLGEAADLDEASRLLAHALRLLASAYKSRCLVRDLARLRMPAGLPGAKPQPEQTAWTAERDQRLAEAYDEQVVAGKHGLAAYTAAMNSDPWLRQHCGLLGRHGLKAAVKRGRRSRV